MAEPDPAVGARLAEHYKAAFLEHRRQPEFHEPLFPGTRELLDALLARDLVLGVATGKAMRGLRFVLELHGLERYFATLQTADLHPSKPHPAMLQAAMAETGIGAGGHHADRRHHLRHPDGARGRARCRSASAGATTPPMS